MSKSSFLAVRRHKSAYMILASSILVALATAAGGCTAPDNAEAEGSTAAAQTLATTGSATYDTPLGNFQLSPTQKTHTFGFGVANALVTSFFVVVTPDRSDIQFSGELFDCHGNRVTQNAASYGQSVTLYRPLASFVDNSCQNFTVTVSAIWLPGSSPTVGGTANFTAKVSYSAAPAAGTAVDSQCWGLPLDRWACGSGQSNSRTDWAYLCQKNQFGNVVPLITQCPHGCANDTCILQPEAAAQPAGSPQCNCRGFDDASSTNQCGARLCAGDGAGSAAIWVCEGDSYRQTSEACTP